jgi:serine/threonine-protein kinase
MPKGVSQTDAYREAVRANPHLAPDPPWSLAIGHSPPEGRPWRAELGLRALPDRYHIVRQVDETEMSVVLLAFDQDRDNEVVIKCPKRVVGPESREADRFRQEVRAAARLLHPRIVQALETNQRDWPWFLVMRFVTGERLDVFARRHALSTERRVRLFAHLCEAVQYAHARGVIHGDLKPDNVVVSDAAEPFLIDFGLSRCLAALAPRERARCGEVAGTLGYMAPERAAGFAGDVRTDIYALGVMLFELLSGRLPVEPRGGARAEELRRIEEVTPPHLGTLEPALPPQLCATTHRAINKDPSKRHQTVTDLKRDLEDYLSRASVSGPPHGSRGGPRTWRNAAPAVRSRAGAAPDARRRRNWPGVRARCTLATGSPS